MTETTGPTTGPTQEQTAELARMIKRATQGRSWCSTRPIVVAEFLLAQGVRLPEVDAGA